jgi:hypothetical protein
MRLHAHRLLQKSKRSNTRRISNTISIVLTDYFADQTRNVIRALEKDATSRHATFCQVKFVRLRLRLNDGKQLQIGANVKTPAAVAFVA